jgi:ABC-2 type transport system permease protein
MSLTRPMPRAPMPHGNGSSLAGLKLRGLWNSIARGSKVGFAVIVAFAVLVIWAELEGTRRAMMFLCDYGKLPLIESCSLVGRTVMQRVLETGLLVLTSGVTFSAITTAILTLYTSDDLNFLLSQPISTARVFALKLSETFLSAAGIPSLLTAPLLIGIGIHFKADWWYYPLAVSSALLAYMMPVGLGAGIAVLLMRLAPLGRVREVATGIGVILSASLVYFIRAARPEELLKQLSKNENFEAVVEQYFGSSQSPFLPPSWAAKVIWQGARGEFSAAFWPLLALAIILILASGWLAAKAYQEGWVRGLESSRVKLDPTPRQASSLERWLGGFGPVGVIVMKDIRLLLRDATQWSQLLILVALGGVYVVSIKALPIEGEVFRSAVGFMTLAFQGFVIAGVGIRMAFPAVSLEGPGYWLIRTGAISTRDFVLAKYWGALPATLILALCMGYFSAQSLALSAVITLCSVMVATSSALVMTSLGVGFGAAMPRFKADNPAEIGISPGGMLYMVSSLAYSALLVVIVARPAYVSIQYPTAYPGLAYFTAPEGWIVLGLMALATVLGTVLPLELGWRRLDRQE